MRRMEKGSTVLNIVGWMMVTNAWEYYITDNNHNEDIVCALVDGDEQEIGDISLSEILPYVISKTKNLHEVMPAVGWKWV